MRGSGHPGHGQRLRGGFTLIELVVVTTLIALVFVLATAQMDWLLPKYRLRGVAREIGALMKQARSRALSSGKDVFIAYDLSGKKYWLLAAFPAEEEEERDPDEAPPVLPKGFLYERVYERALPEGVGIRNVVLGRGQTAESGQTLVRMSAFGMSEHHIVNLYDDEDRRISVRFNGFTGYLRFGDEFKTADELPEDSE